MKRAIHSSPLPEQALGFNCARVRADEGETTDRIATAKHTLLVVMACLALAGCAVTPQILTFNYAVRTVPNATALIASVQSGQTTVAELISLLSPGPSLCNFTADFSGATRPRTSLSGTPGQTGFNVRIFSTAPLSITTTNPSSCAALGEVEINIGGRSEALALGAKLVVTAAVVAPLGCFVQNATRRAGKSNETATRRAEVASRLKCALFWAWPANVVVLPAALRSVTSLEGLDRPWSHLDAALGEMAATPLLGGTVSVAVGRLPAESR